MPARELLSWDESVFNEGNASFGLTSFKFFPDRIWSNKAFRLSDGTEITCLGAFSEGGGVVFGGRGGGKAGAGGGGGGGAANVSISGASLAELAGTLTSGAGDWGVEMTTKSSSGNGNSAVWVLVAEGGAVVGRGGGRGATVGSVLSVGGLDAGLGGGVFEVVPPGACDEGLGGGGGAFASVGGGGGAWSCPELESGTIVSIIVSIMSFAVSGSFNSAGLIPAALKISFHSAGKFRISKPDPADQPVPKELDGWENLERNITHQCELCVQNLGEGGTC
jgi:hypothetical protein